MKSLTERQQNICTYGGVFGALIAITSLLQLMKYTNDHWIAYALLAVYVFTIIPFVLLSVQKTYAPVMLIVATVLSMICVTFVMITGFYSLVLILQFLYGLAICIVVYMENIPVLLKNRARSKREEELAWRGKL